MMYQLFKIFKRVTCCLGTKSGTYIKRRFPPKMSTLLHKKISHLKVIDTSLSENKMYFHKRRKKLRDINSNFFWFHDIRATSAAGQNLSQRDIYLAEFVMYNPITEPRAAKPLKYGPRGD